MTPSPRIIAFIKGYEQCRLVSYMPTPNDRPTIGWGSTGPDIFMGMSWTQADCDERFAEDLGKFGDGVWARVRGEPRTNQNQFDAMVSLAYNIGLGGFAGSTVLRDHNAGNHAGAQAAFGMWVKQAGKVLAGLTKRRAAEAAIYGEIHA